MYSTREVAGNASSQQLRRTDTSAQTVTIITHCQHDQGKGTFVCVHEQSMDLSRVASIPNVGICNGCNAPVTYMALAKTEKRYGDLVPGIIQKVQQQQQHPHSNNATSNSQRASTVRDPAVFEFIGKSAAMRHTARRH